MIKNNTKNNQKCKKGYKGIGMEGFIARWYAGTVEKDLERFQQDARKISKIVSEGGSVLEVAPGPGYLSIELAKLGNYKITGMDISETFIEIAQNNAKEAKVDVEFRRGNVADMPFEDESFDFIFCSSAFKNFSEPVKALSEMYRVLKINGKALIIDLRRDISKKSIEEYVKNMGLSKIDSLFTILTFKHMLLKRAYTTNEFKEFISKTKFTKYEIQEELLGLELWLER